MKFKIFLQSIFSVKNVDCHKQITLLGVKFKFKSKKLLECFTKLEKKYIPAELSYANLRKQGYDARTNAKSLTGENNSSLVNFQILNRLKLYELKNKIKNNKKIRVCFLLDAIAKFSNKTVYDHMLKSELFEPFIVLYNTYEHQFDIDSHWEDYVKEYETIKDKYTVYPGYDEKRNYIPIETYRPDIIFISCPYLSTYNLNLSNQYLNINFLVCYLDYGLNTINNYDYHYNNQYINTTWKFFVATREDYKEIMKHSKQYGLNTYLSGYPKLDAYAKPAEECRLPEKIDNKKPTIIYAPHWTIDYFWEPSDLGTFDIYGKFFLDLVKKYPEFNFVYKPHPSLEYTLSTKKIMSNEEYKNYIKEWNEQENGLYVNNGEYIDLFRKSDLLITDSGSFIGEWLPSGNPCMYLVNPKRNPARYMDGFSTMGRKILEKYYLCRNQEDIENNFKMLMFDKLDSKKDERIKIKDEIFINIGCAGQKIVDYLTRILSEEE